MWCRGVVVLKHVNIRTSKPRNFQAKSNPMIHARYHLSIQSQCSSDNPSIIPNTIPYQSGSFQYTLNVPTDQNPDVEAIDLSRSRQNTQHQTFVQLETITTWCEMLATKRFYHPGSCLLQAAVHLTRVVARSPGSMTRKCSLPNVGILTPPHIKSR